MPKRKTKAQPEIEEQGNSGEPSKMDGVPRQQGLTAELEASTINEERRTVDVLFYSGQPVKRFSWSEGIYDLTFSMDPKSVRLGRLQGNAPLLDSHDSYSIRNQLGVIEKGWLENGVGKATVRFSDRADVEPIWRDVKNGIIKSVSMGAYIHGKLKDVTPENSTTKSYLAMDWEPLEISAVPVGADPGAKFLEFGRDIELCEIEETSQIRADAQLSKEKETDMSKPIQEDLGKVTEPVQSPEPAPAVDSKVVRMEAIKAERLRAEEIRTLVKRHKLGEELAEQLIRDGVELEAARIAVLNKLADADSELGIQSANPSAHASVIRDERETARVGLAAALAFRGDEKKYALKPEDNGYQFIGLAQMGLMALTAEALRVAGKDPRRLTPLRVYELAMTTSDLPSILASTADKYLRDGYATYENDWTMIAARRTASNFKTQNDLTFDMNSGFDLVNEDGEFKYGSVVENKETWRVLTYGKIVKFTRQVIINDDLGAITRVPAQLGYKAAVKQADLVWAVLTANGNLADGNALFSTAHSNYLSSGTAISDASIGAARAAMRLQTSLGGDHLNLVPVYLVVPPNKERLARQYTSTQYVSAKPSDINVYAGTLTVIAEPRLGPAGTETGWYLFASPSNVGGEVVIYSYLSGNEGVYSETRQGFEIDGVEFKARMDFGAGAVDYRGGYLNTGA